MTMGQTPPQRSDDVLSLQQTVPQTTKGLNINAIVERLLASGISKEQIQEAIQMSATSTVESNKVTEVSSTTADYSEKKSEKRADNKATHKCISAVFKHQEDTYSVVQKLLDQDIPKEKISLMGRNFQTETKISGFITKKDFILDGLATGALYGSLFGSLLGLLTGVGVLFVPFVGTLAVAGPLGAALLGVAEGALYGALGAGLGSALISLGMPQDKAAIYQTRLQAGEFLLVAEVPEEKVEDITALLEDAGGEEVAATEMVIPQQPDGELSSSDDISPEMKASMSEDAQQTFVNAHNESLRSSEPNENAIHKAWEKVKDVFDRDEKGTYSQKKG